MTWRGAAAFTPHLPLRPPHSTTHSHPSQLAQVVRIGARGLLLGSGGRGGAARPLPPHLLFHFDVWWCVAMATAATRRRARARPGWRPSQQVAAAAAAARRRLRRLRLRRHRLRRLRRRPAAVPPLSDADADAAVATALRRAAAAAAAASAAAAAGEKTIVGILRHCTSCSPIRCIARRCST